MRKSHIFRSMKQQLDILALNVEHLRVLSSVACNDVMSAFSPFTPMSAREVGEVIGRSPSSVSEHTEKLVQAGLLIEAGTRKRRSRTEQLYLPAGKVIRFQMAGQPPDALQAYMERVRGKLRATERNIANVIEVVPEDESILDFLIYKTYSVHLNRERALKVKLAVDDLLDLLKTYAQDPEFQAQRPETIRFEFMAIGAPASGESRKFKKRS